MRVECARGGFWHAQHIKMHINSRSWCAGGWICNAGSRRSGNVRTCRLLRISTRGQIWPGCCDPPERAEKKNKEGRNRRVDERLSLCGILWLTFKGSLRFRFRATGNPMGNRLVYSWVLWCGLTGWRTLSLTVSYGKIFLFLRAGCKKKLENAKRGCSFSCRCAI